jgi:hypothetical protein
MGDSGESLGHQDTYRNAYSKDCAHEVSEGNEDSWELEQKPCMLHSGKELAAILSMTWDLKWGWV